MSTPYGTGLKKFQPIVQAALRRDANESDTSTIIISEPILNAIRRELRKLAPEVKTENEQLGKLLEAEIIKREVLEGDKAEAASRRISRHLNKVKKAKAASETSTPNAPADSTTLTVPPPAS